MCIHTMVVMKVEMIVETAVAIWLNGGDDSGDDSEDGGG